MPRKKLPSGPKKQIKTRTPTGLKLSPTQAKILKLLLVNRAIPDIAREVGVNYFTVYDLATRNKTFMAAVEKARKEVLAIAIHDAAQVVSEFGHIAFADITSLYNEDGSLKPISEWDDSTRRAVSKIEADELFEGSGDDRRAIGYTRKITLHSKTAALGAAGLAAKATLDMRGWTVDVDA